MRRSLSLFTLLLLAVPFVSFSASAQSDTRYFEETHHNVSGLFLQYWTNHGGLAQQGYPLTEEYQEKSDLNGQVYTVQYFERSVFEHHPENAGTEYEVLLSQLGKFRYTAKYGSGGAPGQTPSTDNPRLFPETGKTIGGKFRAYWEANGGLAQQGYPISDEFQEKSDLNGQTYTVQYFERAVFELHPENAGTAYEVLLSQLGKFEQERRYPNNSNPAAAPAVPVVGGGTIPTYTPTTEPINPVEQPTAQPTPTTGAAAPQVTRTPTGTNCQDAAQIPDARKSVIGHSGAVEIADIHYQGDEYVMLKNDSGATVDIGGWTLRDKNDTDQHYTFPAGTQLPAGGTLNIYTAPGQQYSFNSNQSIWNNCGDAAELVDSAGAVVATYAYGTHLLP